MPYYNRKFSLEVIYCGRIPSHCMWVMESFGGQVFAPVGFLLSIHSYLPSVPGYGKGVSDPWGQKSFLGHVLIVPVFFLPVTSSHLVSLFWEGESQAY